MEFMALAMGYILVVWHQSLAKWLVHRTSQTKRLDTSILLYLPRISLVNQFFHEKANYFITRAFHLKVPLLLLLFSVLVARTHMLIF
jgi:hypothetical protein